jgi:hypothetical protein
MFWNKAALKKKEIMGHIPIQEWDMCIVKLYVNEKDRGKVI